MTDLSKSPDRIARMFDAIAGRYDFLNHLLSAGIDRRWRRRAIQSLSLSGSERVLDLCSGTADLALAAIEARPGAKRVVGVDFSAAMLRVGMGKIRRERLEGRVALVRGDATRIPLADRSVDVVTVAFGIRNVENTAAACAEIFRILAPGGRLFAATDDAPYAIQIREVLSAQLSETPAGSPGRTTKFERLWRSRGREIHRMEFTPGALAQVVQWIA